MDIIWGIGNENEVNANVEWSDFSCFILRIKKAYTSPRHICNQPPYTHLFLTDDTILPCLIEDFHTSYTIYETQKFCPSHPHIYAYYNRNITFEITSSETPKVYRTCRLKIILEKFYFVLFIRLVGITLVQRQLKCEKWTWDGYSNFFVHQFLSSLISFIHTYFLCNINVQFNLLFRPLFYHRTTII